MLTEFSIGNYQAFSTPQRVPIKPITLIFGPNSAGKSALLRSLLVAQHAILNGKLSKSEGANERHPGSYIDMVRDGNSNPISFGFKVHPDSKSGERTLELNLDWKETAPGGLETIALSLLQGQSEVATYVSSWNSKFLQIGSLQNKLRELATAASLDLNSEENLGDLVQDSITRRLSLQKNVSLPGSDQDHFRTEDSKVDTFALFIALEEIHKHEDLDKWYPEHNDRIKATVHSIQSAITTRIKMVGDLVQKELATLTYHGPIRPICDEISKARRSEPGMAEWWNLAADPKLLSKVNHWLASDKFATKYRLEFDRLFPDSSLQKLLRSLSVERDIEEIVEAAFEAKFKKDLQFRESIIDSVAPDLEQWLEGEYEDPNESAAAAREQAYDVIIDDACERGMGHYNSLLADSDIDEIEAFLLLGVNQTLDYLRSKLESVRQGETTTTPGGFDSAKVRFCDIHSAKAIAPSNMGIGFSQMMPLVASAFGSENRLIAIEQPELHIHPALQTELADLFLQSTKERGNRFLIETHSEHLILRLLRRVRETTEGTSAQGHHPLFPSDICVLYVEPTEQGSKVIELPVTADGDFSCPWPNGFFEERSAELF
jgi:predicted ATPase